MSVAGSLGRPPVGPRGSELRGPRGLGQAACSSRALSPQFLAMVFQDLLTNKDDYLRASRALLREIIKQTKHEINFQAFCLGLMQERKEPQYLDMELKVRGAPAPPPPPAPAAAVWREQSDGMPRAGGLFRVDFGRFGEAGRASGE